MSKSSQAREAAKVIVNPLFAWSNAVLKCGEIELDSMQAAAKTAQAVRVAVLPDADAPAQRRVSRKAKRKAKRRR
jgi:hypothetical protein